MTIKIYNYTGDFAENKDVAKDLRVDNLEPLLANGYDIVLDFQGVSSATQSFIHALISQVIRKHDAKILDRIVFKNCNKKVKAIIKIVVVYVQDSLNADDLKASPKTVAVKNKV